MDPFPHPHDAPCPLASIEDQDWELDDGEFLHRIYPDIFHIPDIGYRCDLLPGSLVKCRFRIITTSDQGKREHGERMWVVVRSRHGAYYRGELNNQPTCTSDLQRGMEVWFEPRHVLAIHDARVR